MGSVFDFNGDFDTNGFWNKDLMIWHSLLLVIRILVVGFNKNDNDTIRFISKNILTFLNHNIYADAHKYASTLTTINTSLHTFFSNVFGC